MHDESGAPRGRGGPSSANTAERAGRGRDNGQTHPADDYAMIVEELRQEVLWLEAELRNAIDEVDTRNRHLAAFVETAKHLSHELAEHCQDLSHPHAQFNNPVDYAKRIFETELGKNAGKTSS
jgi:hypothetical protein